jgi:acyl-CoA thioesterase
MDTRTFLGLEPSGAHTETTGRWSMEVRSSVVTGSRFLFGGAAHAAAVSAMEGLSGRQVAWSTAQYLDYAMLGECMDLDVTLEVVGNSITQARVVGRVDDREIIAVNAALGERNFVHEVQYVQMPQAPSPETLERHQFRPPIENTIHEKLDQRYVIGRRLDELDGTYSDGHMMMWARIPEVINGVDAATLAVLGDFIPMGVGQALGLRGGGNSLDNTLRVVRLVPTQWVLVDIHVQGVHRGIGHGTLTMFAEDGTLLATASQSCIVRLWK